LSEQKVTEVVGLEHYVRMYTYCSLHR